MREGQEVFLPCVLFLIRQTKQRRWVGLSVSINNSTLDGSFKSKNGRMSPDNVETSNAQTR